MEKITIKIASSDQELSDAMSVRRQVFQDEQGIDSELDFDGQDKMAEHAVAYSEGNPVGTARARYLNEKKDFAKIERVAVVGEFRKFGLGKTIMEKLENFLFENGVKEVKLESQEHAKGFYEKIGYKQEGEVFEEVGIPHVEMRKDLKLR